MLNFKGYNVNYCAEIVLPSALQLRFRATLNIKKQKRENEVSDGRIKKEKPLSLEAALILWGL